MTATAISNVAVVAVLLLGLGSMACAGQAKVDPTAAYARISVADFGAVVNDKKDDTAAVSKAIAAGVAKGNARIVFPKGRYDFRSGKRIKSPWPWSQLQVVGARGMVVDGQGSKFVFHGRTGCFMTSKSHDVIYQNFTIDWDEPLFSAGIITRADKRSFDVELSREYTGEGSKKIESVIEWDAKTLLPLKGGQDIYDLSKYEKKWIKRWEKLGPGKLRCHLYRDRLMHKGAHVVLRHQTYVFNAFSTEDSKRVTFRDLTIHYAPGMGITAKRTEDVTLKRVTMAPPKGSGRALSIASDGTHFWDCTGTIRIEDSYFKATGDDVANVHGHYFEVTKLVDAKTVAVKVQHNWLWPPYVGDTIEFTDPRSLIEYAAGKVAAVETIARGKWRITFAKPLPEQLKVAHYLANATLVPKVRFSGNHIVGNRSKGFLIKSRDAIVENNVFEDISGVGLAATVEGNHWRESIGTRKLIFRNNKFINCNGGPNRLWGVIAVFAVTDFADHRWGDAGVHRDIIIENNVIEGTDNCGIFVSSSDGVVIRGNKITACSREPSRMGGRSAIYLNRCRNVVVSGNTLTKPGARMKEALGMRQVEKDTITVKDNKGF